jgi:predicted membrane channel-forming protein YqfA (hemolysin III family)
MSNIIFDRKLDISLLSYHTNKRHNKRDKRHNKREIFLGNYHLIRGCYVPSIYMSPDVKPSQQR